MDAEGQRTRDERGRVSAGRSGDAEHRTRRPRRPACSRAWTAGRPESEQRHGRSHAEKNTRLGGNDVRAGSPRTVRAWSMRPRRAASSQRQRRRRLKSINGSPIRPTRLAQYDGSRLRPPDPTSAGVLYAGTSDGVFRTANDGDDWSAFNQSLASRNVVALAASAANNKTTLYAGIAGGGAVQTWAAARGRRPTAISPTRRFRRCGRSRESRQRSMPDARRAFMRAATVARNGARRGAFGRCARDRHRRRERRDALYRDGGRRVQSTDGGANWTAKAPVGPRRSAGGGGARIGRTRAAPAATTPSDEARAPAGDRLFVCDLSRRQRQRFRRRLVPSTARGNSSPGSTGSANFPLKAFTGTLAAATRTASSRRSRRPRTAQLRCSSPASSAARAAKRGERDRPRCRRQRLPDRRHLVGRFPR